MNQVKRLEIFRELRDRERTRNGKIREWLLSLSLAATKKTKKAGTALDVRMNTEMPRGGGGIAGTLWLVWERGAVLLLQEKQRAVTFFTRSGWSFYDPGSRFDEGCTQVTERRWHIALHLYSTNDSQCVISIVEHGCVAHHHHAFKTVHLSLW
jgi:hypothetical protein